MVSGRPQFERSGGSFVKNIYLKYVKSLNIAMIEKKIFGIIFQ